MIKKLNSLDDITEVSSTYPDKRRAKQIYDEAFRKAFEYIYSSGFEEGAILEFGTGQGFTAKIIASLIKEFSGMSSFYDDAPDFNLYLYDSFEGFPESKSSIDLNSYELSVRKRWLKGMESVPEGTDALIEKSLLKIINKSQLTIVKGFFEDTLEINLPDKKAVLVHIDCDLYSSTKYVLNTLLKKNIFQDGCVIMFDDFNCNRANPNYGERKALVDTFGREQSAFTYSDFFSYGWHGKAFFIHEKNISDDYTN